MEQHHHHHDVALVEPPAAAAELGPPRQSFVLPEGRHITALDLQFAVKGSDANDVTIDIVEGDNGFPGRQPITRTRIKGSDISTTGFTTATFDFPIYWKPARNTSSF